MKKTITISTITLLVLAMPTLVLAQGNQKSQGLTQQQDRIQDPIIHDAAVVVSPQGIQQGQGSGTQPQVGIENKGIETATQNLNRVVERSNDPEIGEQVRTMVQNHEKVQVRTKTALNQMNQRKQAVKLLIGPDYKNAGQVRSDVVGLRNDIEKLEQIKADSLPVDAEDVQSAIDKLQVEADGLETQLTEQLSGFSLFGWLSRILAK